MAEGAAFRLGCAAALLIARGRLVDELLDRAIWGHDELTTVMREEDRSLHQALPHRQPPSASALLARLDRMVETRAREGEEMLAQIIAGDWPGFLSLFDIAPRCSGTPTRRRPFGRPRALALPPATTARNPLATLVARPPRSRMKLRSFPPLSTPGPNALTRRADPEEQARRK